MASLQEQLKAAQIEKAEQELLAIERKTFEKEGKLVSRWDAECDINEAVSRMRTAITAIPSFMNPHNSNGRGGEMIAALNDVIRKTLNAWVRDGENRESHQHEG